MTPMAQRAKALSKNGALLSVQCVLLIAVSVAFLSWIVFGLRPIQESMVPLDCLHCFVFKLDTLCSNSAFLLLLCNAIIGALMALSKSSESPDIYTLYSKESESRRKQVGGFAEASSKGKNWAHSHGEIAEITEIYSVENVQQFEIEGGHCCSEEKSMWASSLTVVPYQGDISNEEVDNSDEELDKKFDQFIIQVRRQMSLERQG